MLVLTPLRAFSRPVRSHQGFTISRGNGHLMLRVLNEPETIKRGHAAPDRKLFTQQKKQK
jgi:hypothetical protein